MVVVILTRAAIRIGLGVTAARDRISLTWERNDRAPLSEEHDISENMLILRNVQREDEGVYNCLGIAPDGTVVFRRPMTLKVVGKFMFHTKS